MSWSQNYNVERLIDFAHRLSKKGYALFIEEIIEKIVGKKIVKIEQIILDEDYYGQTITGNKITFADGTAYIHKLVERYTSGGNYGCDIYELVKESEEVKVKKINEN